MAHGVRDNGLFVLAAEQQTLAEILKAQGYRTGAAIGGFPLIARYGLNQGFDFYDDRLTPTYESPLAGRAPKRNQFAFEERRAGRVNEAVFGWLARERARAASSSGSTTTTRTSRTTRRRPTTSSSPTGPTTARSPTPTRAWARCSTG